VHVDESATDVKSYPAAATQTSKGKLFSAGLRGPLGVRFSAQEHLQFLAHLRHGAQLRAVLVR